MIGLHANGVLHSWSIQQDSTNVFQKLGSLYYVIRM